MSRPQEEYDTLVNGSLLRGVDEHGRYATASFEQEDLFVDVIRRPGGYGLEFGIDRGLKDVYQRIQRDYQVEGLIQALGPEGNSFYMDPDAWQGGNYEDFIEAYMEFDGFGVEWADLEDEADRRSLLNVFSNTNRFEVKEPVFQPAWRINSHVADVDDSVRRDVFNDIRFFLDDG